MYQEKNKVLSNMSWLNDMRILAALAIIFVHVTQFFISAPTSTDSLSWWTANLYLSFTSWGVPVFVMISGALLLSPDRQYPNISTFYKKRINRLLLPLVFWTVFYLLWSFLKSRVTGATFELDEVLSSLLSGEPYYHMWYLYMVFGLYLVTPYLRKVVKYSTERELIILAAILMFISVITVFTNTGPQQTPIFIQKFPYYLGYFFTGYLIFNSKIEVGTKYLIAFFILFVILTAIGKYYFEGNFYNHFSITIIPMSISLMFLIKKIHHRIPINPEIRRQLAMFSLGAYLIHPAVLGIIKKLNYFNLNLESNVWIIIPLIVFLTTFISLVIAYLFSKTPFLKRVI